MPRRPGKRQAWRRRIVPRQPAVAGCVEASWSVETPHCAAGCDAGGAGAPVLAPAPDGRRTAYQAWNSARLIAAALVKIRMPRTTTTPVASCEPTPIWSPT